MFKNLVCKLIFSLSLASAAPSLEAYTFEIDLLEDMDFIPQPLEETLYLFDLDDTLFDSAGMLGTKAWRGYIKEATKHDPRKNWHDCLSYFIAQHYPLKTVEATTSDHIKKLQDKGYMVLGFTARERNMWYGDRREGVDQLTVEQLTTMNIDFSRTVLREGYEYIAAMPQYYGGILFADTDSKGEYLLKLFKGREHLPKKVIFVDDKFSHIESVEEALDTIAIENDSFWYIAVEHKSQTFNPAIADIQLYYLWTYHIVLTDAEAAQISEEVAPEIISAYLQTVLNENL